MTSIQSSTSHEKSTGAQEPEQEGLTPTEVLAAGLQGSLSQHQHEAQAHFDALHASQKHLTSHLRALLNALDGILQLAAPRPDPAALEQLRAAAGKARALQARLKGIVARLDKVEAVLAPAEQQQNRDPKGT